MPTPTLYIMCGLPYSGKTILTQELVRRFGFKTASVDDVMDERGLRADAMSQEEWNAIYSEAYTRLKAALAQGQSVVFDMGHLTLKERTTSRQIAESMRVNWKLIYINTSITETRNRWAKNATTQVRGQLSDHGLAKAQSMFQAPTPEENPIIYNQSVDLDTWIKDNLL